MNTVPISDFDDVILFELQKKENAGKLSSLTFGEIWKAAADASPNFNAPVDPTESRRVFVARMMEAIDILHKCEFIHVSMNYGDKIDSIQLTDAGKNHIAKIVFTGQQRIAKV